MKYGKHNFNANQYSDPQYSRVTDTYKSFSLIDEDDAENFLNKQLPKKKRVDLQNHNFSNDRSIKYEKEGDIPSKKRVEIDKYNFSQDYSVQKDQSLQKYRDGSIAAKKRVDINQYNFSQDYSIKNDKDGSIPAKKKVEIDQYHFSNEYDRQYLDNSIPAKKKVPTDTYNFSNEYDRQYLDNSIPAKKKVDTNNFNFSQDYSLKNEMDGSIPARKKVDTNNYNFSQEYSVKERTDKLYQYTPKNLLNKSVLFEDSSNNNQKPKETDKNEKLRNNARAASVLNNTIMKGGKEDPTNRLNEVKTMIHQKEVNENNNDYSGANRVIKSNIIPNYNYMRSEYQQINDINNINLNYRNDIIRIF